MSVLSSSTVTGAIEGAEKGKVYRPAVVLTVWCVVAFSRPELISPGIATTVAVILVSGIIVARRGEFAVPVLVALFGAYLFSSTLWSADEPRTLRNAFVMATISLCAVIAVGYLSLESLHRAFDVGLKIILGVSLILLFVSPAMVLENGLRSGSFSGLYGTRNMFGSMLTLGLATHLYTDRQKFARYYGWAALYLYAVVRTESAGALVVVASSIVLFIALGRPLSLRRRVITVVAIPLVALIILFVFTNLEVITEAVGRNTNFSGRNEIWAGAINAISVHPLGGYGWGVGFAQSDQASEIISQTTGWVVPSAHNGILTVAVQVGVLGGAIALLLTLQATARAAFLAATSQSPLQTWIFQIAVLFIIDNVVESRYQWLFWFTLVIIATQTMKRARQRA